MSHTISSAEVGLMDEKKTDVPKCPKCGKTTRQILRGWGEGYENYRCGHCNKRYTRQEGD